MAIIFHQRSLVRLVSSQTKAGWYPADEKAEDQEGHLQNLVHGFGVLVALHCIQGIHLLTKDDYMMIKKRLKFFILELNVSKKDNKRLKFTRKQG